MSQPARPAAVRSIEAILATFGLVKVLLRGEARDLLVKTCRSGLRIKEGDRFRDVYFDGLLEDGGTFLKMEEINSPDFDEQAARASKPAELDPVVFTFWGRILGLLMPVRAKELCWRLADTLQRELGLEISPTILRLRLSTVYWQVRLYRLLLARVRPKAVLVSDTGEYALRIASHRQNVLFVELQHGIFDASHPDAIPAWVTGPAADLILPDVLASRGRYWIEQLAGTRQGRDHAVAVGSELIDEARLRRRARAGDKSVHFVLTTQGLDSKRLVSWIKEMIAVAPPEVDWRLSIKLHPVYDRDNLDFAGLQTSERIRVIGGSEQPNVFDLLVKADLHFSIASACHFDAAALGVRTIVIPLAGHEQLLPAVDGTQIFLARDPADVWAIAASPVDFGFEDIYRFSEPGFVANMRKLAIGLAESRISDQPVACGDSPGRQCPK
ncbi:hypothetical protein FFI89_023175 [Bradyrhizobium sp. KBS0727]|uniref:hypothetical protein n=1 Tax=unclassified Bradyrhizobium TaxID=2631580 RepID=UPI00110D5C60|nr:MULTISPECIES: hypothetical protein [unclassified Bradyrhizobium]QDW39794.1 hypothetical protein FFI71_023180 [Bradyrhizobium sp. KBS0725]QDW46397.1 hypothetical protein FFI89_023175 [Bradyrhizobium sp. KBS0727]